MKTIGSNVPASVHARLLKRARERREDFNLTLQRFAAERFLFRLGASKHREQFVLKGAMLFALWGGSLYRSTRDLDLTGYARDDARDLVAIVREICDVPCSEDGMTFRSASVRAEPIRDKSEYHGFRVKVDALLGKAELVLQIDIGLGDSVVPAAQEAQYPVLVDCPAPRIRAYPREAVVAEKLHAMANLGAANSRYKDFYDVFVLATHFSFSGMLLAQSIAATFARRRTTFQRERPLPLTPAFYSEEKRAAEWQRYLSRNALSGASADFTTVGELVQTFLGPVWNALAANRPFVDDWPASGPWKSPTTKELRV